VTIIAALMEADDSVLLSADTGLWDTATAGISQTGFDKLRRHPSAPVAWATHGDFDLGYNRFTPWLQNYKWPPKSWPVFVGDINEKVNLLNRGQRDAMRQAGIEPSEGELFGVVMIGVHEGVGHIVRFESHGTYQDVATTGFTAAGIAEPHAAVARVILSNLIPEFNEQPPVEQLRRIIESAIDANATCARPITMLRASGAGVVEISDA
jgi:hypothetical protein